MKKSYPTFSVYVFVLFPTDISKKTRISIEHDGGAEIRLNIAQKSNRVTLNYEEAKKLAEYINGMELKSKPTN